MSLAVEKTSERRLGIVVFLSIIVVVTPPRVSIPRVSGVTSNSRISETPSSPAMIPACRAAPIATASSGLIPLNGALPVSFSIAVCTAGTRVEPPTRMTLSTSPFDRPASFIACRVGFIVFSTSGAINSSNLARETVMSRCSGCPSFIVMNGRFTCDCPVPDNSIFAFSAASFSLLIAWTSFARSIPDVFLYSATK